MSRVGLSKRLHAIRSAIKAHDPRGYAIQNLPPQLRRWYDSWRRECDLIAARHDGNRYKAMLDGQDVTPPMPPAVAAALDPDPYLTIITPDMPLDEIQDRWKQMLEEGR